MTFKEYKEEAWRCRASRERGRHVAIRAANALINCAELGEFYEKKTQKLEAENADLKRQVTEAISYILSNEGASMIDCRTCFFVSSCECEPKQSEPNYEMCERAVRKYIEDSGE